MTAYVGVKLHTFLTFCTINVQLQEMATIIPRKEARRERGRERERREGKNPVLATLHVA
jgi:hypothetical protein